MGINVLPAPAAGKTRYVVTLLSGTSWTVPTGCLYVNATLIGGGGNGGAGSGSGAGSAGQLGQGGQIVTTNLATTPGASITYAIGAGGGGSTTLTGATTAVGGTTGTSGAGGIGNVGTAGASAGNGGAGGMGGNAGGTGGQGKIEIEYWA